MEKAAWLYSFSKRCIDLFGAALGLLLTFPVLMIVSAFYLFGDNKGPILFTQTRIGRQGRPFSIYKFRSMVVGAEQILMADPELYAKYTGNNFKLEQHEDPRLTPFGRFIRKTSLDELPQFFNVLKGDMSLVGPRPVVAEELNEYTGHIDDFLSVKPGITGYWQVCGRSGIGYPERVGIELYYVYNRGLLFDLKILCKTIYQVLARKGAY